MIEIIMIFLMCRALSRSLRPHGIAPGKYHLAAIGFWFLGEVAGVFVGRFIDMVLLQSRVEDPRLLIYGCALLGAACGGALAFRYARNAIEERVAAMEDERPDPIDS